MHVHVHVHVHVHTAHCTLLHYTLHMHCMALALKAAFVLVLWRTVEQSDSPKERLTKATTANAAQEEN